MPSTTIPSKRIQKVCTIWTHEPGSDFSTEDVVFNIDRFVELGLSPNSLAQIIPIPQGSTVKDFVRYGRREKEKSPAYYPNPNKKDYSTSKALKALATSTFDENGFPITGGVIETDEERAYVFVAKDASPAMKQKYPQLQVSAEMRSFWEATSLTYTRSHYLRLSLVCSATATDHTFSYLL
jgi:hypothetical protein